MVPNPAFTYSPIFPYVVLVMSFFRAGRRTGVDFLLYYGISVYDRSRAMSIILKVYSVLLSYLYFRHCLWESINNHTQSVGEQGRMIFPSLSSPSPPSAVTTAFENFEFLLGVKDSMFLLPDPLSVACTMFRVRTEIYRGLFRDLT